MANPGSKFVSANLNKSFGQHQQFSGGGSHGQASAARLTYHLHLQPLGVLGIKVKIMLDWDPKGKQGPMTPLPDLATIHPPKVRQPESQLKFIIEAWQQVRQSLVWNGFINVQRRNFRAT